MEEQYYQSVKYISNKDCYGNPNNRFLHAELLAVIANINSRRGGTVEKIEFVQEGIYTNVFIFFKTKELKEFEKSMEIKKEQLDKEEQLRMETLLEEDFPNKISKNLFILRGIVGESLYEFAKNTCINPYDLKKVESGKLKMSDNMLRAIKERFPSISIKTFTNGEREDF
ncbi:hypothetical protein [Peptacetobacter hiranonis]|uniref:Uncharacterized protein n=1 Tax=Peptacetobacter hiranonis (strain DSM 13275 / JCM 10541 / KCTC 15199 / TO-931) TaxID=500633 RepID=B6FWU4_PEPHT|nr:hypothetical protein [Peptacetobacter hiranonis]EEA86005.1 hypothetical protein CLOHIR_00343 [Peptacetobacter hiranonis DSM 13275]QEK21108.1 hypothetical protein KGNDJEFE_01595 [Peptacetobacter hiranonis]